MNWIKKAAGRLFLKLRSAGEQLEIENYRKRFASIGENVRIARNCKLIPEHMYVGNNVVIGENACLMASVSNIYIGDHVVMGPGVIMRGGDHRFDLLGKYIIDIKESDKLPENDQSITIGNDVWIGQGAVILKGVTIGEGCVIGAGSIVTKDVPPYTIHVGVHGPYEKRRFTEEEIQKHKELLQMKQKEQGT